MFPRASEKITERGITAERLTTGDLRYSVNIMVDGQRIHRVIRRDSDGTTRAQAEEFIAKARSDARAGRLNLPKGRKVGLTFKRAAEIYLQRLAESGGKGLPEKEQHLRLYFVPELGNMPAADTDGWIFPNTLSKSGHTESMKAPFRQTVLRAGLDPTKATTHTLRHTAITEMAETGVEARTIQAFSGHQSREMVWRYTHTPDQRINEAMERFDAASTEPERLEKRERPRS